MLLLIEQTLARVGGKAQLELLKKNDWKEGCYKNYVRINVDSLKCRKSRSVDASVVQILHAYNDTFIDYIAHSDEYY